MNTHLKRERYVPPPLEEATLPRVGNGFWGRVFDRLFSRWGDPHWWPGRDAWEVAAGAVLTQNTAWTNVEKALANLRAQGITDPGALLAMPEEDLAAAIRPSGYYNAKARKLRELARWWRDQVPPGEVERMGDGQLRESLLAVWGIGPETADSIACYAFGRPLFVVDAYTARVVVRTRGLDSPPGYDEIQHEVHAELPRSALLFNHLHGLLVVLCKEHCTARAPRCEDCPLLAMCDLGRARTDEASA